MCIHNSFYVLFLIVYFKMQKNFTTWLFIIFNFYCFSVHIYYTNVFRF